MDGLTLPLMLASALLTATVYERRWVNSLKELDDRWRRQHEADRDDVAAQERLNRRLRRKLRRGY